MSDLALLLNTGGDVSSMAVLAFIVKQHIDIQVMKTKLRDLKTDFEKFKEKFA